MKIDLFLSKLEKVRKTGNGTWTARCPSHDDGRPSLSIRETEEGKVLLYCFALCSPAEIVSAVGMQLQDLFPDKDLGDRSRRERAPYPAADVLVVLAEEARLVAVAACNLHNGFDLTYADKERLMLAQERIEQARRLAIGER